MEAYASVIGHYPHAVVAAGVDRLIATETYMPKPADLLKACYVAMPDDYRNAYRLRTRLLAIMNAPVVPPAIPLSADQKSQLVEVLQRVKQSVSLGRKDDSC